MKRDSLIFCNLVCSGASAIDPILRELLGAMDYWIVPFGPEATSRLAEVLDSERPIYHWTHDPLQTFRDLGLTEREDYKFIYLHRDFRDVAVSWMKDGMGKDIFPGKTEIEALETVITHMLPPKVTMASEWVAYSKDRPGRCLEIRFDEIRSDIRAVLERIFTFLGIRPAEEAIQASVERNCFEALTGRRRGEEGPPIRTAYFLRKGISGEWKGYLDADLGEKFKQHMGDALIDNGWETDRHWGLRECQIVSAPFSSGVTWLVNVLLELNIRTTNTSFLTGHWGNDGKGAEIGPKACAHLKWHLPVLHERTKFSFEPGLEVLWEHRLDFALHPERPTILYVRDPRDAIYSLYKRSYAQDLSFIDYLRRPDLWRDHFPGLFGLPPAETWAYFHLYWLAMQEVMNVQVIRFEDMRARPLGVTQKILEFLGVRRPVAEVERALELSTYDRARGAMERTAQETGESFLTARRGKVGEWKEVYQPEELSCFGGPAHYAMRRLGYEAIEESSSVMKPASYPQISSVPEISQSLEKARDQFASGNLPAAESALIEALSPNKENPRACLAVASSLTAFYWTRLIFPGQTVTSPQSRRAYLLFREINEKFSSWPSVREAVETVLTPHFEPPQVIREGYQGFNIVKWKWNFYALDPSWGKVNLSRIETLPPGGRPCIVGTSLEEVLRRVDEKAVSRKAISDTILSGKAAIQRGDFQEALAQFERLTGDFGDLVEGHLMLATVLMHLGRLEDAILSFERAAALTPWDASIPNRLGIALYQRKNWKGAEEAFRRALRIRPRNVDARVNLAQLYLTQGQEAQAAESLKEAARLAPGDEKILSDLGSFGLARRDLEACSLALERLQAVRPNHFLIRVLRQFLSGSRQGSVPA